MYAKKRGIHRPNCKIRVAQYTSLLVRNPPNSTAEATPVPVTTSTSDSTSASTPTVITITQTEKNDGVEEKLRDHSISGKDEADAPKKSHTQTTIDCNCKKTNCLKLYCPCFAGQVMCQKTCRCLDCYNNDDYSSFRQSAIKSTLQRNPNAFDQKIRTFEDGHTAAHKTGCKCRMSMCLKKYCECFAADTMCTSICICINCRNGNAKGESAPGLRWNPKAEGASLGLRIPSDLPMTVSQGSQKQIPAGMQKYCQDVSDQKHAKQEQHTRTGKFVATESGFGLERRPRQQQRKLAGTKRAQTSCTTLPAKKANTAGIRADPLLRTVPMMSAQGMPGQMYPLIYGPSHAFDSGAMPRQGPVVQTPLYPNGECYPTGFSAPYMPMAYCAMPPNAGTSGCYPLPTSIPAGMPTAGMPTAGMPTAGMPTAGMPTAGMPTEGSKPALQSQSPREVSGGPCSSRSPSPAGDSQDASGASAKATATSSNYSMRTFPTAPAYFYPIPFGSMSMAGMGMQTGVGMTCLPNPVLASGYQEASHTNQSLPESVPKAGSESEATKSVSVHGKADSSLSSKSNRKTKSEIEFQGPKSVNAGKFVSVPINENAASDTNYQLSRPLPEIIDGPRMSKLLTLGCPESSIEALKKGSTCRQWQGVGAVPTGSELDSMASYANPDMSPHHHLHAPSDGTPTDSDEASVKVDLMKLYSKDYKPTILSRKPVEAKKPTDDSVCLREESTADACSLSMVDRTVRMKAATEAVQKDQTPRAASQPATSAYRGTLFGDSGSKLKASPDGSSALSPGDADGIAMLSSLNKHCTSPIVLSAGSHNEHKEDARSSYLAAANVGSGISYHQPLHAGDKTGASVKVNKRLAWASPNSIAIATTLSGLVNSKFYSTESSMSELHTPSQVVAGLLFDQEGEPVK